MCKTKPVFSEAWAELRPAQRKERWKGNADEEERGGEGVQVRRGKNLRQGESLDKDKTDSTTTNKQDPQDTPAGRWICWRTVFDNFGGLVLLCLCFRLEN